MHWNDLLRILIRKSRQRSKVNPTAAGTWKSCLTSERPISTLFPNSFHLFFSKSVDVTVRPSFMRRLSGSHHHTPYLVDPTFSPHSPLPLPLPLPFHPSLSICLELIASSVETPSIAFSSAAIPPSPV